MITSWLTQLGALSSALSPILLRVIEFDLEKKTRKTWQRKFRIIYANIIWVRIICEMIYNLGEIEILKLMKLQKVDDLYQDLA